MNAYIYTDQLYNEQGDMISEKKYWTDSKILRDSKHITYRYTNGKIVEKEVSNSSFDQVDHGRTSYTYIVRYVYDSYGNLTELVYYILDEKAQKIEDSSERHTLIYNKEGNIISDDCIVKNRSYVKLSWHIQYEYDAWKNCIKKVYTEKRGLLPTKVIETKYSYYE